uniref:Uncharacterized protein n=1 Tax=Arundo donax TaxID=35708 RepID=A0A0A8Z9P7_ARUDO
MTTLGPSLRDSISGLILDTQIFHTIFGDFGSYCLVCHMILNRIFNSR